MQSLITPKNGRKLSVAISVGPMQKTSWSVSIRAPVAGGGFGAWTRIADFFSDQPIGSVNRVVDVDDCLNLDGHQITIVFFVQRVNPNAADPFAVRADFRCDSGASIGNNSQSDSGTLAQPHVLDQFDFVVALQ